MSERACRQIQIFACFRIGQWSDASFDSFGRRTLYAVRMAFTDVCLQTRDVAKIEPQLEESETC